MTWRLFYNVPNPYVPNENGKLVPNGGNWVLAKEFDGTAEEVQAELALLRIEKRGAAVRATSGTADIQHRRSAESVHFGLVLEDLGKVPVELATEREAFIRKWMAKWNLGDDPARLSTSQLIDLLADPEYP